MSGQLRTCTKDLSPEKSLIKKKKKIDSNDYELYAVNYSIMVWEGQM